MIMFFRVVGVKPGKTGATLAFAKEMAAYLKKAHKIEMEVLVPVGGRVQRVGWAGQYADLGAMDAAMTAMTSDPKYWELANAAADNFIPGSFHDEIWKTV